MDLRAIASLFVASSVLTFAYAGSASAQAADTSRVMGLRFEATLFNPFDVRGTVQVVQDDPARPVRADVFRPQGDIRIGYDLPGGLTPVVGIGVRTHSIGAFDSDDKFAGGRSRTDLTLAAELRYYFGAHTTGLQPFVFGEFNTTLVSYGTAYAEDADPSDDERDNDNFDNRKLGAEATPMNINAGLGMEYKFSRSFAVGGKWGLGVSFAGTGEDEETIGGVERRRNGTRNTVFGTSSSIYLAYRI